MELLILNESLDTLRVIDIFESLLWTERFNECGDFEFYAPVGEQSLWLLDLVAQKRKLEVDVYAWMNGADSTMIIENAEIQTDPDEGSHVIISGRSLESLLDRRIIWKKTVLNGNLQNGIKKLLNENAIIPDINTRTIPNLVFENSSDPAVTSLSIRAQYTGDNLYETIVAICQDYQIGFKIRLRDDRRFAFSLYAGADRSYDQTTNPYVTFSNKFENLADTNYLESIKTMKNVALVAGEDSELGSGRRSIVVGSKTLMARRELFVDARDIQSEDEEGEQIPEEQYNAQLRQRGSEKLSEYPYIKTFEGNVEARKEFIYGEDFFKGDIVQIVTDYGVDSKARVLEFIRSQDKSGYNTYPTFASIE